MTQISLNFSIKIFNKADIPLIVNAFAKASWLKPASIFEAYLQEQKKGERVVWVAKVGTENAGYVTLQWKSKYEPFAHLHIPEIMDLNVLPPYRSKGIGSKLLETAEEEAKTKGDRVWVWVYMEALMEGMEQHRIFM
jgi:GNAT superfamily N-acetyltransferase